MKEHNINKKKCPVAEPKFSRLDNTTLAYCDELNTLWKQRCLFQTRRSQWLPLEPYIKSEGAVGLISA